MITGEKVKIRAVEPADVQQLWEWSQDEETMRYRDYPAPPASLAEAKKQYEESIGQESRHLRLAITTLDGELIGETSLRDIDQRAGTADFAIAIGNKNYWNKGLGTDATNALIRYAFEQMNLRRITLYVHEYNKRAIHVYEKCGFRHEGVLRKADYVDGHYSDTYIMGLLREEFPAVQEKEPQSTEQEISIAA